jgi:site-specific DNA recombinase
MNRATPHSQPLTSRDRTVVAYCRVSSREQAEGYSIEAQLRLARELVAREGLDLAHAPFVEVHTAKEEGRPVFKEMLAFLAKNPRVGGIVAHEIDRLGRNLGDLAELFENLKLRPWLVDQAFPDNPQGRLAYNMLGVFAKYYSDNLREEVRKGQAEKVRQGGTPFKAPHGYLQCGEAGGVPVLDPERRSTLHRLFEDAATARFTLDELQDRAFRWGYRFSKSGARIPRSTLERILKNPYYVGEIHYRGVVTRGRHEALVARELFDRVQSALARTPSGYGPQELPYRGLLRCTCGRAITPEHIIKRKAGTERGRYLYYRCARYKDCGGARLSLADLEGAFGLLLKTIQPDDRLSALLQGALALSRSDESELQERATKDLERRARDTRAKLDRLLRERVSGTIDEDEFRRLRSALQDEARATKEALANSPRVSEGTATLSERATALARRTAELWLRADRARRERLLRVLCVELVLEGRSVRPRWRRPFSLLVDGNAHVSRPLEALTLGPPETRASA